MGLLAVLPFLVDWVAGANDFLFSATSLLVVVSTVRDIMYELDAELKLQGYYEERLLVH